jgi:hypothetical protein
MTGSFSPGGSDGQGGRSELATPANFASLEKDHSPEQEEEIMAELLFGDLKREMDEACQFLHLFTLGRRGFTRRDILAGIARVGGLCDQMKEGFESGPHAKDAADSITSARKQIERAEARLTRLPG